MKKYLKSILTVFILVTAISPLAHAKGHKAHEQCTAKKDCNTGQHCKVPTDDSSSGLKFMKSLEGKWMTVSDMFGKKQKLYVEYKVTAGGSAVVETIFPGTPYEMMSVYFDENDKLAMTHYCIVKNRPHLKLSSSTDNSITMKVAKIEGMRSKNQPSMGDMTITLTDKNHFTSNCGGKDAKGKTETHTFEYTRIGK